MKNEFSYGINICLFDFYYGKHIGFNPVFHLGLLYFVNPICGEKGLIVIHIHKTYKHINIFGVNIIKQWS